LNILVVNYIEYTRNLISKTLKQAGFRVVGAAGRGREALQLFKDTNPDVVIMDLTLPEIDGFTLIKNIMKANPVANIIICSDLNQKLLIQKTRELGVKDYIVQPFKPQRLIAAVKKVLNII
jgi:two-component system chemotaxis response regulator CheY